MTAEEVELVDRLELPLVAIGSLRAGSGVRAHR